MNVAIIGAGSIGMLIGSYISEMGANVTMLVRRERQQAILNEKGIHRIDGEGNKVMTTVQATTHYVAIEKVDLIIIAVKYKDLQLVLNELINHAIQVPVLFVQNGIAHLRDVEEKNFPNVAFATIEHGALKEGTHVVHHNGIGKTTIGARYGDQTSFEKINQVHTERFPIHWHDNPEHILLRKALINCLINPLTTLLGVRNGMLVENEHSHYLMQSLYSELMETFPYIQKELKFEDIEQVCKQTATNQSSMLTDYRNGRQMEIDTIVSAVILKGKEDNHKMPLLETYEQLLLVLDKKGIENV